MEIVFICTHSIMAACAAGILSFSLEELRESRSPSQKMVLHKWAAENYEVLSDTTRPPVKSKGIEFPEYIEAESGLQTQNV
jgi:hypothetical protein